MHTVRKACQYSAKAFSGAEHVKANSTFYCTAFWACILLRGVAWWQEMLDGLDCLPANHGAPISPGSTAARAKHALRLSDALGRLLLKRLQGSPEELILQVSLSSRSILLVCSGLHVLL